MVDNQSIEIMEDEKKDILAAFQDLLEVCRPNMKEGDEQIIQRAFEMADKAHHGVKRKSGEPYILHPIAVAKIAVQEIGLGTTSAVCALLHDTVEDTDLELKDIKAAFSPKVEQIVDGLTKISIIKGVTKDKKRDEVATQAENLKKILLTLSDDVRVILIKIADRLHNMRTLKSMPERKKVRISSETLYIYSPMAHRLGLYAIKTELEDLCMKHIKPVKYKEIAKKLAQTKRDRNKFIKDFIEPLKKVLKDKGLKNFKVFGRSKSINSIWNKIKTKNVEFEEIYDLFAIRIVIDVPPEREKEACWKAYSIISDIYRPIVERLRDWISNPKSNGYESLHTTVMGPNGKLVEVQIRSDRMDQVAEKGVAAHWKYKGGNAGSNELENWILGVREALSNSNTDAVDFVNDFKLNLYEKDLYVFTPKGDLKTLRAGATVIDFAYEIHTAVGRQCIGAKINNKLYPITHKLENGSQVQIITSKKQKPSTNWLDFVATSKARASIKSDLKEEKRLIADNGKMMFERKMKSLKAHPTQELIEEISHYFKQKDTLDFFYNIATNNFDLNELKNLSFVGGKIKNLEDRKPIPITNQEVNLNINEDIDVMFFGGLDNVEYSPAPCCNPKPGDSVFGFITINTGIKIHRDRCPNAPDLRTKYPYRIVKTKWAFESNQVSFLTGLKVTGIDDVGLINRLTNVISKELGVNMRSISFDTNDSVFEGNITVFVNSTKELNGLIKRIKEVDGVYDVKRYEA